MIFHPVLFRSQLDILSPDFDLVWPGNRGYIGDGECTNAN